ncbi:acyl carrier protein [Streptomyces sp. NPDC051018]|uniref:acyl carrier protein n=1 Tax=Streptomyces sp. NPDC051018 TaxID=3365639 RepID=UPI0037A6CFC2
MTATAETKDRLRKVVVEALRLDRDPATLPEEGLRQALDIDSVAGLELLIWVENEFGIQIDDEDLSVLLVDSLNVLGDYVEERLARAGGAPSAGAA